jgi:hypothetical protein
MPQGVVFGLFGGCVRDLHTHFPRTNERKVVLVFAKGTILNWGFIDGQSLSACCTRISILYVL